MGPHVKSRLLDEVTVGLRMQSVPRLVLAFFHVFSYSRSTRVSVVGFEEQN